MKKAFALVLALAMIFAMAIPAMAADGVATNHHKHTISIDSKAGYVYEAYQIFYGDLDEKGTLSNIVWGSAVKDQAAELLVALKAADEAYKDCNDAEDVAGVLAKNTATDNEAAMAFADIVGAKNDPVEGTNVYKYLDESKVFKETTTHSISVDSDGYYLIVNSEVPDATDVTYSRYMLEVVRDVTVTHKGTFPTVEKKIVEDDGSKVNINEASIGDLVHYELNGTLPTNLSDYDTYYYVFSDSLSKGLTYNNDAKVYVNGLDVTKYFYISASAYDAVNGTEIIIGMQDILTLENITEDLDPNTEGVQTVGKLNGGFETTDSRVIVTYSATLNENAVVAVAGNPNVVDLEYSNDPNNDGDGSNNPPPTPELPDPEYPTGKTPEKEVETYTTKLSIQKTDGVGAPLKGAEFQLTGENLHVAITKGNYYVEDAEGTWYKLANNTYTETVPTEDDPSTENVNEDNRAAYASTTIKYKLVTEITLDNKGSEPMDVKAFVDENGQLSFTGLGAGKYELRETVTPAGFNTMNPNPIEFTITFNYDTKEFRSDNNQINVGKDKTNEDHYNSLFTTIVNHAGSTLPSTGGIGTTLFYVFGGLMFVGAAVLLVTKKRMAC